MIRISWISLPWEFYFSIIVVGGIISISTFFKNRYSYLHPDETGKVTFLPHYRVNSITAYRSKLTVSNDHSRNVVLTMFSTSKKDPQRHRRMPSTIDYMVNFYVTVKFLNINAIIFYDNLSSQFVRNYATSKIQFKRITMDPHLSINDYRFLVYSDWLKYNRYKYVLMVDLADVFFWKDPFVYMEKKAMHSLFVSRDLGTLDQMDGWDIISDCATQVLSYNAWVWGGSMESVQCMLNCEVEQLNYTSKSAFNCDIIAFNWCIINGRCAKEKRIDGKPTFVNPFLRNCEKKYDVIHDKCGSSSRRCMSVVNGTLVRKYCRKRHGYYKWKWKWKCFSLQFAWLNNKYRVVGRFGDGGSVSGIIAFQVQYLDFYICFIAYHVL